MAPFDALAPWVAACTPYEPIAIAGLIGLVPAFIAHHKGYNFVVWWACGAGLFVLVLPLSLWIAPDVARHGRALPRQAFWAAIAFGLAFAAFALWGP